MPLGENKSLRILTILGQKKCSHCSYSSILMSIVPVLSSYRATVALNGLIEFLHCSEGNNTNSIYFNLTCSEF